MTRRWRHLARGSTYIEIGRASFQVSGVCQAGDGSEIVVYRGEADGRLWARPAYEFEDGRFEALPADEKAANQSDMEALLRAAYPGEDDPRTWGTEHDPVMNRILAHIRAEKAKAYHQGRVDGSTSIAAAIEDDDTRHDLEVEAAALERAAQAQDTIFERRSGMTSHIARCMAEWLRSLISPASRTALSERDARVREEGRKEGLRQIIRLFRSRAYVASSLHGDEAKSRKMLLTELAAEIEAMSPHPAQGAEEGE